MFYICFRNEDGTQFYFGNDMWCNAPFDPQFWGVRRLFYTEAYARKVADMLEARMPGRGYERGPIMVRKLK